MSIPCMGANRELSYSESIQDGWHPSFILAGAKRMSFRATWKEKEEPRGNKIGDVLKSTYSYCMCVLSCWKCYCFYLVEPATLSWRNNIKKGQDHQIGLVVKTFQHIQKSYCVVYWDVNNRTLAKIRTILWLDGWNLTAATDGMKYQFCGRWDVVELIYSGVFQFKDFHPHTKNALLILPSSTSSLFF